MTEDKIREVKKAFFARRNGVVAEALRKSGDSHRYIMGCQITDVMQVADAEVKDRQLACALWNESEHRECRLLAPMLMPKDELDELTAREWLCTVQTVEEVDVLCHRLLRYEPYASRLANDAIRSDKELNRYAGYRLIVNLRALGKDVLVVNLDGIMQRDTGSLMMKQVLQLLKEE